MNKDNNIKELDELLGLVEHAGRDARRQKQIAAMIEQMAASEQAADRRKRGRSLLLWTARAAAAACVTGFIITTFHFINKESPTAGVVTAEVEKDVVSPMPTTDTMEMVIPSVVRQKAVPTTEKPTLLADVEEAVGEAEEETVAEPMLTEETHLAETVVEEAGEAALREEESVEPVVAELAHEVVSLQEPRETASAKADETTGRKKRLFRLRQSQPSDMEGTTLPLFAMNL